jgi:hypothetical protein
MGFGKGDCMNECMSTSGCEGIQFQKTQSGGQDSIAKGTCILIGSGCKHTGNTGWDVYGQVTETDYSKTTGPGSGAQGGGTAEAETSPTTTTKLRTTITVTTTKRDSSAQVVFINEILYQSDNQDVPGVEIAGPDGTDLSDYTIYTYSMAGKVTNTVHLDGSLSAANQQDYGVKWFNIPTVKFNSVALAYGSSGALKQFLSVIDHVTAQEPPASGSTSEVIKHSGEPLQVLDSETQMSLQLYGSGEKYEDFQWHKKAKTPGEVNALQNF